MRIKQHHNKNEYLLTPSGLWVRNFAKTSVPYLDINRLTPEGDYQTLLENEVNNSKHRYPWVDTEGFRHPNVVIVMDGHGFAERHKVLAPLPAAEVAVMAVNGALARWKVSERSPTYYVVNNPYHECVAYLPKRVFPKCIASTRTNHGFLKEYKGTKYRYVPVSDDTYTGPGTHEVEYQIDDYRNPVCAAVGLAYRFGVRKLLLLCCDDSFAEERPGAEPLPNGLWAYPQQRFAHSLIDGSLYWLRKADPEIQVRDCSDGLEYENASYITPEEIRAFFEDEDD